MRKWQRVFATTAGLLMLLSLLAACGPSASTSTGTNIKNGGSVIDAIQQEPDTILPWFTSSTFAVMVQTTVWAPLYFGDPNGVMQPGIADVPSASNGGISSDLKSLTIKLKSGVTWSDGSPITSDDCVFTYNLVANPDSGSLGFPLKTDDDPIGFVSATAVDTKTFKLTFRNANADIGFLLADAASTCLPKKVFGSVAPADMTKSPEAFKPTVTSGAFTMTERVAGDHITVKKNPKYYQGPDKPHLDQINFKVITDQSTILAGYQNASLDTGWFLDATRLASYKALQGYKQGLDSGAGYEWLIFNLKNPILADLKVRQALVKSIDRTSIYHPIYNDVAKATCDDHQGTFAHEDTLTCYGLDVAGANSLLDGDGWVKGADGIRVKNGQKLELNYTTTTKTSRKQTQAVFQDAWKAVGIKVNLINLLSQNYFGSAGALCHGQFDIGEFASGGGYGPSDYTSFQTGQDCAHGGGNYGSYSNSTVDQAEAAQLTSNDQNFRKQQFHTIHQQILQDLPVMYLFVAQNVWVVNNHVCNYNPSALGGSEVWNVWDWYRDDVPSTNTNMHAAARIAVPGATVSPATTCHIQ
jgi:peptide/nickel transport system substrate-binding protein